MFTNLREKLKNLYTTITTPLKTLFGRPEVDAAALKELENLLIQADMGIKTTRAVMAQLTKAAESQDAQLDGAQLKALLRNELAKMLITAPKNNPTVYLLVGINGSGKTTCASKLAQQLQQQGERILLVAADTFRAAAADQLQVWAERTNVGIIRGKDKQEPASVVFQGCVKFREEGYTKLIIDTAGRLQTKANLMQELAKIGRIITQQLPEAQIATLLTIDSMLGQNSLEQAQLFHESTPLHGIILTKMDSTGKGGIVFAIQQAIKVPVTFISYGEQLDAFAPFDGITFIDQLLDA